MGKGTGRGGGKGDNDLVKLLCVARAGLGCSLGAWFSIVASQIDVACDALMIFKLREGGFCTGGEDILNGAASHQTGRVNNIDHRDFARVKNRRIE